MGTLNQHRSRPTLAPIDLRPVTVAQVMAQYKPLRQYLDQHATDVARPEHEALSFYLTNAAVAQVMQRCAPDEPLQELEVLVDRHHEVIRVAALRLFFYLLLICTRESRHLHSDKAFYNQLAIAHGCMDFTKAIKGMDSMSVVHRMISNPPPYPLGKYTDHLVAVFSEGAKHGLFSGGFGGKAWAEVAKVLRGFVHGTLSAELMLDTGFCLSHNNGPIFNKEVLYTTYNDYELKKILDVQRAGMIPQLVHMGASPFVNAQHREFHAQATQLLGAEFQGVVDWDKVMSLGAVQNYSAEKAKQPKLPPDQVLFVSPALSVKKVKRGGK